MFIALLYYIVVRASRENFNKFFGFISWGCIVCDYTKLLFFRVAHDTSPIARCDQFVVADATLFLNTFEQEDGLCEA